MMLSLKKMLVVAALVTGGLFAAGASQAQAGGFGCGYGHCYTPIYKPVVRIYTPTYYYAPTYYAPAYGCFGY